MLSLALTHGYPDSLDQRSQQEIRRAAKDDNGERQQSQGSLAGEGGRRMWGLSPGARPPHKSVSRLKVRKRPRRSFPDARITSQATQGILHDPNAAVNT